MPKYGLLQCLNDIYFPKNSNENKDDERKLEYDEF
jgi:hypothetical protein